MMKLFGRSRSNWRYEIPAYPAYKEGTYMLKTSSALVKVLPALALSFLLPFSAVAGTITFFDLTDVNTVTDDTGRGVVHCGLEFCLVSLFAPTGGFSAQSSTGVFVGELGGSLISDMLITGTAVGRNTIDLQWSSDDESGNLGTCSSRGGCTIIEDGTVQTLYTVIWNNANGNFLSSDTIKFQSDAVPEPSTMVLILVGFAVLGIPILRRWAVAHYAASAR